jgi:ribosomal protein L37E
MEKMKNREKCPECGKMALVEKDYGTHKRKSCSHCGYYEGATDIKHIPWVGFHKQQAFFYRQQHGKKVYA